MNELNRAKVHLLVIEDNPADIDLLRLALRTAGLDFELTAIDDGGEALDAVRQKGRYSDARVPDLTVLDLNLPKNDGLEILEAMRSNPAFADVPVAVLSSSSSARERAKLDVYRVARYITKPLDLDEYLRIGITVKEILGL